MIPVSYTHLDVYKRQVQSSEKSGPQLPETGQANDTALLALGVAAEMAAVMGVAYSHRRRKDV